MIWVCVTSSVCFLTFLRAGSSRQRSAFPNCHITMIDSQHYNSTQLPLGPARVVGSAEAVSRTSLNAPGLLGSGKNGAEASTNSSMCRVGSKQSRKSLGTGNSTNESKELSSAHWNSPRLQQWVWYEPGSHSAMLYVKLAGWTISLFESIGSVIFLWRLFYRVLCHIVIEACWGFPWRPSSMSSIVHGSRLKWYPMGTVF